MRYLIFILTSTLLLQACSPKASKAPVPDDLILTETGTEVEMLYTENGMPSIKIIAPKTIHHNTEQPYTEFPDGMELLVFGSDGTVESTLNSNYGTMADGSGEMLAKDSVKVVNLNGETLFAEELTWNQEEKVIFCDGKVTIVTKDEIIYGTGFYSNENFTEYEIFNISGIVNVKDEEL